MKPSTPLPWSAVTESPSFDPIYPLDWRYTNDDDGIHFKPQDAAYIVHAANAYPRLIKYMREIAKPALGGKLQQYAAQEILRELGEEKEGT